jgi:hypothetical protein
VRRSRTPRGRCGRDRPSSHRRAYRGEHSSVADSNCRFAASRASSSVTAATGQMGHNIQARSKVDAWARRSSTPKHLTSLQVTGSGTSYVASPCGHFA